MNFELLETKRLILKGLTPSDMSYIFENCSKPEIKELLGHRSEEDYQKEEKKHKNGYSCYNRSFKLFLLTDKASGSVLGRCGFHNWNAEHRRAEIGYAMELENYKRKGLMTEALDVIITHGFNKMNLHRIEALVGPENIPSLKLMAKYDFIQEGILREHHFSNNTFEDSILFSRLLTDHKNDR